ncbi:MAG TPA: hypothetical protein VNH18_15715, partial [Bryobacteraceae bacterium]|nr:hypothetical protein [Bryobacteraceae bacterium]
MPRADRPPLWLWINLLSLDAPLVAVVWQDFLARCYGAPLLPQVRWALGLTVWAIYIADRLLDVRTPASGHEPPLSRFYRTNLWLAAAALALILSADLLITVEWLRPAIRVTGFFVLVATLTYLATFTSSTARSPVWKSASAALLFAAGVFAVAWT